jgi:NAD(P)-dependent dehydrogenase (short-subunit alcohol dehydrogenase family)
VIAVPTEQAIAKLSDKHPKKRAFITGAGSGLGLAFATGLAKDGWHLGLSDVNEATLASAADSIRNAGGKPATYVFDVADEEQFQNAVNAFEALHGGIDIGINNAGIGCGGMLEEVPIKTFRRVIDINLMGVVNGCHAFIPVMKKAGRGHILNVASAAGFASLPEMSAYNASKAAVISLSETLRSELFDFGISVSVLMPTYIRTNIGRDAVGPEKSVKRAIGMVNTSKISSEECASFVFSKMSLDELYIVMPEEARFLWRFKRFMPDRFWRFVMNEAKRRVAQLDEAHQ